MTSNDKVARIQSLKKAADKLTNVDKQAVHMYPTARSNKLKETKRFYSTQCQYDIAYNLPFQLVRPNPKNTKLKYRYLACCYPYFENTSTINARYEQPQQGLQHKALKAM